MTRKRHKRNGRGKPSIHGNRLKPSSQDVIALANAMEERFLILCGKWKQAKGDNLPIPEDLWQDLLRWRTVQVRHKIGDFRNSDAEWESMKVFAQWTVDVNCELCGQPPKKLEWR